MAGRDRSVLDDHAVCLREAAARLGIPTEARILARPDEAAAMWLLLRLGRATWYFRTGVIRRDAKPPGLPGLHINGRAAAVTTDKMATKRVLSAAGIAVPRGRTFGPAEVYGAIAYAAGLGQAVCVKPNRGRKGILAFPGQRGADAVAAAFERVALRYGEILVEESVTGEVVRFFYVRPASVAVKISRPPNVVGDGFLTIAQLIIVKNLERQARALPGHNPILVDDDLERTIAASGLSLSSIPAAGRRVMLLAISNGAAGADSIECADAIDPSYARQVEAACAAIPGIRVCAIDMMIRDRRTPAAPGNHWVLELNSSPGLLPYHHPWEGRPQDVAGAVLAHLSGAADRGRARARSLPPPSA